MAGPAPVLRVKLDAAVRRGPDGRTLWRARPLRRLRLSEREARTVCRWDAGEPVASGDRALASRLLAAGLAHPAWSQAGLGPADVTVVIPIRDRTPLLARLLPALGDVADVVIVDDGSREPVAGARVRHESARGPAAARNAGWPLAATSLVAFVDSDCLPEPGWLERLLPHFADPRVAVAAPRIVSAPGPSVLARYERARAPHDLGPEPGAVRARGTVTYVSATVLVARRAALADMGGFSDDMRFGEDLDLVYRLAAAGWTTRYEPGAVAVHLPRARLGAWMAQRFSYGTTDASLLRRHPACIAPLTASPLSVAAWVLAARRRLWPALAVAAGSAALTCWQARDMAAPADTARLAAAAHLTAGRDLTHQLVRSWWPLTAVAAAASPSVRRTAAAGALALYLSDWRARRPDLDAASWCALRLLDDLSYGTGVWAGCLRHRTATPLRPDLRGLPGLSPRA